jgi:hypothetical protein
MKKADFAGCFEVGLLDLIVLKPYRIEPTEAGREPRRPYGVLICAVGFPFAGQGVGLRHVCALPSHRGEGEATKRFVSALSPHQTAGGMGQEVCGST